MTKATLSQDIEIATASLLQLARESSWNKISDNCLFILSEVDITEDSGHLHGSNAQKRPERLEVVLPFLFEKYDDLYDVNLYVYFSSAKLTVVEIRYILRSSFDENYRLQIANNEPMLHCKVPIPIYAAAVKKEGVKKFDINWHHNGWWHRLITWWWKMGYKIGFRKM